MESRRSSEAPRSNRKKILTMAEKNQIRNFHHSHPLVTHTQIANFFGLERSTVTKIIGQPATSAASSADSTNPAAAAAAAFSNPASTAFVPGAAAPSTAASGVDMTPPDGHMSVEAFQTQSHVTRALTLWAQQKQQQGVRVTQKMIRQEAANLAALHERSLRGSNDSSSSTDTRGGSPGSSYSRASSAATTSSSYSNSGVGGWNQEWSLNGEYRADPTGGLATTAPAPAYGGSWTSTAAPAYSNMATSSSSALDVNNPYLSSSHKEAFRATTERLRSGSDPSEALEDLTTYLKTDTDGMSSFDFLCLEHLRERVSASRKRSSHPQFPMDWAATAAPAIAGTALR